MAARLLLAPGVRKAVPTTVTAGMVVGGVLESGVNGGVRMAAGMEELPMVLLWKRAKRLVQLKVGRYQKLCCRANSPNARNGYRRSYPTDTFWG